MDARDNSHTEPACEKLAYTIPEFCAAVGVGRTSAYLEIAEGRLRSIRAAGRRLILKRDALAWLENSQRR